MLLFRSHLLSSGALITLGGAWWDRPQKVGHSVSKTENCNLLRRVSTVELMLMEREGLSCQIIGVGPSCDDEEGPFWLPINDMLFMLT